MSDVPSSSGVCNPIRIAISHQQQAALRKRDVKQSGGGRKRKAHSNLVHDQKRRERPKLIQGKQHREQAQESPTQAAISKDSRRKQIQPNRNADQRSHEQYYEKPLRKWQALLDRRFQFMQGGQ